MNIGVPKPFWYPLFEHMRREHGLTFTDSELAEIARKVDESRSQKTEEPDWLRKHRDRTLSGY